MGIMDDKPQDPPPGQRARPAPPLTPLKRPQRPHSPSGIEDGGPAGPEPTRYSDWERKGRVSDF